MFFSDKQIVVDHQYGKPGYRYVNCQVVHTYPKGDKEAEKRALMRANNDKRYAERDLAKPQRRLPIRSIFGV
jgi:hypothetical protein